MIEAPRGIEMGKHFTLEYWVDEGWYVGKLKEIPGIFSQGQTLKELKENVLDAYRLMMKENEEALPDEVRNKVKVTHIEI